MDHKDADARRGPDDCPDLPAAPTYGFGRCDCRRHAPASRARRLFTGLLGAAGALSAGGAWAANECLHRGKRSFTGEMVPAEQVEQAGGQQYAQMLRQAQQQRALAASDDEQLRRLRYVAQRIVPLAVACNGRSRQWNWEVNLLMSKEINAFCMPGGKIAFYFGILQKLQLTDDEVAMVMGHEISHALLEHAREQLGNNVAKNGIIELGSALLGLGSLGRTVANIAGQLVTLRFSRSDESEADLLGMELAARAGYDPASGVTLWEKMGRAAQGQPIQMLSTHPSGPTRISDIRRALPSVQGLYQEAAKPDRRFAPPRA